MANLLLEAVTHVKNISKKKPTVKRILAHVNSVGANNWDESIAEKTLCFLHTKGILNDNYLQFWDGSPMDDSLTDFSPTDISLKFSRWTFPRRAVS